MGEYEDNSDDCYDLARENGEEISKKLPQLELHNYYCHRLKYAITELKIKRTMKATELRIGIGLITVI